MMKIKDQIEKTKTDVDFVSSLAHFISSKQSHFMAFK